MLAGYRMSEIHIHLHLHLDTGEDTGAGEDTRQGCESFVEHGCDDSTPRPLGFNPNPIRGGESESI